LRADLSRPWENWLIKQAKCSCLDTLVIEHHGKNRSFSATPIVTTVMMGCTRPDPRVMTRLDPSLAPTICAIAIGKGELPQYKAINGKDDRRRAIDG
jgi:hypothetical protein